MRYYHPNIHTLSSDQKFHRKFTLVLRGKIGQTLTLFNGKGKETQIRIKNIQKKNIDFEILSERSVSPPKKNIHLVVGIPNQKSKWEFILQKATELGVSHISPMITEFSQGKFETNSDRIQQIIIDASEQSERDFLPIIHEKQNFSLKENLFTNILFFDPSGEYDQFELLKREYENQKKSQYNTSLTLFIGPEGGWSNAERQQAQEKNIPILHLGNNILRMETAVIVALGRIYD